MRIHTTARLSLLLWAVLTLFSLAAHAQDDALYRLPDTRARLTSSSSIAFANNEGTLVIANMLNDTLSIVSPFVPQIDAEVSVGHDPRSVAVTPDNRRALVVNRGDGTLSVVDLASATQTAVIPLGLLPYGVVVQDEQTAYVTLQGEDAVLRVDLDALTVTARIDTPPSPAGLALWGDLLYVTHLWSGELSLVHLPPLRLVETVTLGTDLSLSQSLVIDPERGLAFLPQTRLYSANPTPTFDSMAFPVVNVVDLATMQPDPVQRVSLDTADRPVNMPFAAAVDVVRRRLYVANAGSDSLSVVDLTTQRGLANLRVNANPRGVLLTANGSTLYVHNMLEGTVNVIDAVTLTGRDNIPINTVNPPNADILFGVQLYHSARDARLSADGWLSCATCHFDGLSDGRVWQGYGGATVNTPLLLGLDATAPYTHTGAWDELADLEVKLRQVQAGRGLLADIDDFALPADVHSGLSLDMESLTIYLFAQRGPSLPPTAPTTTLARGAEVFSEQGCADCHGGAAFSDGQAHDVGTGGAINTPSLRWLRLSAPYLHDGSAATLRDVFVLPGDHQIISAVPPADLDALVAYLESLGADAESVE